MAVTSTSCTGVVVFGGGAGASEIDGGAETSPATAQARASGARQAMVKRGTRRVYADGTPAW